MDASFFPPLVLTAALTNPMVWSGIVAALFKALVLIVGIFGLSGVFFPLLRQNSSLF